MTGLYVFAGGPDRIEMARLCVASLLKFNDVCAVVACHQRDVVAIEAWGVVPLWADMPLSAARRWKVDPFHVPGPGKRPMDWPAGITRIICLEPDVLCVGKLPPDDGMVHVERRDSHGSRELLHGHGVGTGILALPNNDLGRQWSDVAASSPGRTEDRGRLACSTVGDALCRVGEIGAMRGTPGDYPLVHYATNGAEQPTAHEEMIRDAKELLGET